MQPVPLYRAYVVLWAGIGGWLLGVVVLFADFPFWNFDGLPWNDWRGIGSDGPFLLWATAICVQPAAWLLAFPAIRAIARRWRTPTAARSFEVNAATVTLLILAVVIGPLPPLLGLRDPADTIPNHTVKRALINAAGLALALYAIRAMWYLAMKTRTLASPGQADEAVVLHQQARGDLQILLGILGALVTLAVISAAALRGLTLRVDADEALPPELVIIDGIVLSFLLGLIYVPAYLTLQQAGQRLRDEIAPMPPISNPAFGERLDQRSRLDALFGLDISPTMSLRSSVAILSPLLGSLTSLIPDLVS
ncbi:MAG TPA: hypothetical protein VK915_03665 [Gaiellaceae bacterium]|nr:hypothetical protein [Gaiellaceae bacterium]